MRTELSVNLSPWSACSGDGQSAVQVIDVVYCHGEPRDALGRDGEGRCAY
jgi:hypothetical protein